MPCHVQWMDFRNAYFAFKPSLLGDSSKTTWTVNAARFATLTAHLTTTNTDAANRWLPTTVARSHEENAHDIALCPVWGCIPKVQRLDAPPADGALSHVEQSPGNDTAHSEGPFTNPCLCMQSECQQGHPDPCMPAVSSDGHALDAISGGVVLAVNFRQRQPGHTHAKMSHACSLHAIDRCNSWTATDAIASRSNVARISENTMRAVWRYVSSSPAEGPPDPGPCLKLG